VAVSGPVLAWVKVPQYLRELGVHLLEQLCVLADRKTRQALEQLQRGIDPRLARPGLIARLYAGVIGPDPVPHIGVVDVAGHWLVLHRLTNP
jgi:hypothetical protein